MQPNLNEIFFHAIPYIATGGLVEERAVSFRSACELQAKGCLFVLPMHDPDQQATINKCVYTLI